MIKIKRNKNMLFQVQCYVYLQSINFYTKLYDIDNIVLADVAKFLQGRVDDSTIEDTVDVLLLTNNPAYISDDGRVSAVA